MRASTRVLQGVLCFYNGSMRISTLVLKVFYKDVLEVDKAVRLCHTSAGASCRGPNQPLRGLCDAGLCKESIMACPCPFV